MGDVHNDCAETELYATLVCRLHARLALGAALRWVGLVLVMVIICSWKCPGSMRRVTMGVQEAQEAWKIAM